ncbi:MAG: hypothetical protein ACI9W4_001677 [Rhodothermales bacterium]|jgi:hypothetical protein
MMFLFLGVAIGVLVMGLLRAWTRYEAGSMAAFRDEATQMREAIQTLTQRVESLETIAVAETSTGRLDLSPLSDQPLSDPAADAEPDLSRRQSKPQSQAP